MFHGRKDYDERGAVGDIPEEEPVFLIRGQDRLGAAAVRAYAELLRVTGGDHEHIKSCMAHAHRMELWADGRGKAPDMEPLDRS